MSSHRFVALLIAVGTLAGSAVFAQQPPSTTSHASTLAGGHSTILTIIQGNALSSTNAALPDVAVRLRDARTGRIVAATRTDKSGLFTFRPIDPGSYVVELVGEDQRVLAAGEILNINAGDTASAVVKLPFRLQPYAGVLGHTAASAMLVTATAAATGVLASQVAGEPVSPRR
jgi:hypothetical protein